MWILQVYIVMQQLTFYILSSGWFWDAGQEKVMILKVTKGHCNILVTGVLAIKKHMAGKAFHEGIGQSPRKYTLTL